MSRPRVRISDSEDALRSQAEVLKLARLLGQAPERLEYLQAVPLTDLRELREQVTDVLFSAQSTALARLAAASKLLPIGLIATIAEKAFGPLVSARIAGLLEPSRAVAVAAKLPPAFLADVAIELDPRRASDVIAKIPAGQIADVTRELVRRDEHVTMGRFVGHLSDEALVAAIGEMDDLVLLRVTFVLEEQERLERIVWLMPERRLESIAEIAAGGKLALEARELLTHARTGSARRHRQR
jgi:hypothetical protein